MCLIKDESTSNIILSLKVKKQMDRNIKYRQNCTYKRTFELKCGYLRRDVKVR